MKRKLLLLLVGSIFLTKAFSQFTYTFTSSSGTYTANGAPTQILGSGLDDSFSGVQNIGFSFEYGCTTYTQFTASTNGWMGLGTSSTYSNTWNDLNTEAERPKIAPLWDDLATGSGGNVNFQLTGTAPNRVLTVEWKEMEWNYSGSAWAISFQAKLYETTNVIEFIYERNGNATNNVVSASASIGLAGQTSGQFYSLDGTGASPTASTVTETTTLDTKPANGRIYQFTPSGPTCSGTPTGGTASASPTSTSCASLNTTLTVTGASNSCGISYQWQSSPDNATWTNIVGANSTTYVASNSSNTYYRCLVLCANSGLSAGSASVLVTFTGAAPGNDLPCSATAMTVNVPEAGTNICAGNASEPAIPACWTGGTVNTVWYSFVATSANMSIKTALGTLTDTQIGVFSGTCGSLTPIAGACNNDEGSCGFTTMPSSLVNLTGLSIGTTYFIAVDGANSTTGTFTIYLQNTGTAWPPVQGQDCPLANPVCAASITAADPGYQGIGNTCDLPSSYCLASAERGSVWYNFTTNAAGNINFDIIPNNWPGAPSTTGADYDFAIWRITGGVSCATILAGTATPDRCNYSGLGVTGLNGAAGNAPAAYPGFDAAYESQLACANGDQFILVINNHSTSTDGFTINFSGGSPINYTGTPTSVSWTGGANTAWNNNVNWGSCAFPTCAISAVVNPFVNQPTVVGTMNVNNLTINPGATLTLAAGSTLNVCGNFANFGNIVADPTSTVVMLGTGAQNMTGSFIGANALGNLTITKASGSVVAQDDITLKTNFLTSNGTSIFNSSNKYIRVGGNFTNNNGNTTYSNTGSLGTLEFNGTAAQTYNQGASQLDLNFVVMNQTGAPGVTLVTNMFIKTTTGRLTLTNGRINTGALRVDVANSNPTSVTTGNVNSYVNGNLYRTLNGTAASYDLPVGTATLYERANITFTTVTAIPRLISRFDSWGAPANNTLGLSECATTYNLLSENMGFWTINASALPNSGTYNTTLYCTGATNTAPAMGWTVEKSTNAGATWILNGTCAASTAAVVVRNGMNGFSLFAAAQATLPLPIELTNFSGHAVDTRNQLNWTTASEINNQYFALERSNDGVNFNEFGRVDGAGNSNVELNYVYMDDEPFVPITYYRLKQIDFDGTSSFSDIIAITNTNFQEIVVNDIHPNPSNGMFYIDLYVSQFEEVTIDVTDTYGKEMSRKTHTISGTQTIEIDGTSWSTGVYMLKVKSGVSGKEQIFKIIKIK